MQTGKFNILLDQAHGSSGKGKITTWLADHFGVTSVSSSNFPNAGHSAQFKISESEKLKFIAKAIPTSVILKKYNGLSMTGYISPGSGFRWEQILKEWLEAGRPELFIHSRASIVTESHAARERQGSDSTKHIASTMQGTASALSDKILRRPDCQLAGHSKTSVEDEIRSVLSSSPIWMSVLNNEEVLSSFLSSVHVLDAKDFRSMVHERISGGTTWLHEGSQGYALSIDHGSHYPASTSRNCTAQAAMDQMAIPAGMLGDVYLNLRTFPIRVGNVVENGVEVGNSGGFYSDAKELNWTEVARRSGMPESEAAALSERERTTVTKRVRRVFEFSFESLKDAVRTNGATKLAVNFVQYLNWTDAGLKGGKEAFNRLSPETRGFIDKVEACAGVPVVLVGTGADHDEIINLL
jgi:adenylosuccinate synthase